MFKALLFFFFCWSWGVKCFVVFFSFSFSFSFEVSKFSQCNHVCEVALWKAPLLFWLHFPTLIIKKKKEKGKRYNDNKKDKTKKIATVRSSSLPLSTSACAKTNSCFSPFRFVNQMTILALASSYQSFAAHYCSPLYNPPEQKAVAARNQLWKSPLCRQMWWAVFLLFLSNAINIYNCLF